LGLAAGIILYIVCNELIPESRKIWNGRMTTVATIIGVVAGLLLLK
jgi:ZIP family zinc transporter